MPAHRQEKAQPAFLAAAQPALPSPAAGPLLNGGGDGGEGETARRPPRRHPGLRRPVPPLRPPRPHRAPPLSRVRRPPPDPAPLAAPPAPRPARPRRQRRQPHLGREWQDAHGRLLGPQLPPPRHLAAPPNEGQFLLSSVLLVILFFKY